MKEQVNGIIPRNFSDVFKMTSLPLAFHGCACWSVGEEECATARHWGFTCPAALSKEYPSPESF